MCFRANTTYTDPGDAATPPRVPWRRLPLTFLAYVIGIVAMTWPWLRTASSRVLDHWDPPFHAWKLHVAAAHALAGHLLPPIDSNLYYPYPGAYYYEALHWPQGLFAAVLEALGANPVLSYHVTFVFFWAFSGALFWALMRALGLGRAAAALGGLFFTLMPYRMSYLVEFNMQLAFGLPLFLFAALRYIQRPCARYVFLGALAWWLQATSELYQAVFMLATVPFLAAAVFGSNPRLVRDARRFWLPLAVACALCGALSLLWLGPYLDVLDGGTLLRSDVEMRSHALEPFSYLRHEGFVSPLPSANAQGGEMCVYPTLALLALAVVEGVRRLLRRDEDDELCSSASTSRHSRIFPGLAVSAACVSLALLALARAGFMPETLLAAAAWVAVATLFAALVLLAIPGTKPERRFFGALGASALLCFFLSFGPSIADRVAGVAVWNPIFTFALRCFHALRGFRVIARFSVFVELFLCMAAACCLDYALRRCRSVLCRAGVAVAALALFLLECIPASSIKTRPVRAVSESVAIRAFDALPDGPHVLAIVPMGVRELDSEHMLMIERNDRLGVYAWGGTYPTYTMALQRAFAEIPLGGNCANAAELLRQLWPEALILEDRRSFPTIIPVDYAARFGPLVETLCDDGDFKLLRVVPDSEPRKEFLRLVRHDLLVRNPAASFTLVAHDKPAIVWLDLNGRPVGRWVVDRGEVREVALSLPEETFVRGNPNRLRFHAEGDEPFLLRDFTLHPGSAASPSVASDAVLPWLSTSKLLPSDAIPLDIAYPRGIRLCGAERLPSSEGVVRMRFHLRLPRAIRRLSGIVLATGIAEPGGGNIYEDRRLLTGAIDQNALQVAAPDTLHSVEVSFPLPKCCRPGTAYEATFTLRADSGRVISGHDISGHKVRHARVAKFAAR